MTLELARQRIALQLQHSFRHLEGGGTSLGAVDELANFLASPGALERPALIVRLRVRGDAITCHIVTSKDKIHKRLVTQFLPFVDRVRHQLQGDSDVLVLLSDTLYVHPRRVADCIRLMRAAPFLRADWSDADPVSSHAVSMPDPFVQDARYAADLVAIDDLAERVPFGAREDLVKWRGRLTGPDYPDISNYERFPRYKLLRLAATQPSLIDARLTHYDNIPSTEAGDRLRAHLDELLGGLVRPLEPYEFGNYKFLVSMDGVVATWKRVANILRTGSVLLLQNAWKQYFYPGLMPWEHYVPIAADVADLGLRVEWLRAHPEEAEAIGSNGRHFAEAVLSASAIENYFVRLMERCATLPRNA